MRLMYDALQDVPMDYALLDCQASFCQSKGEGEMALECAKRAVTAAPSEFSTWARLAEVYVGLEQWDLALLTLNSCPMFTYQDKDTPRMPQPSRIMLPILGESMLDEIDEGQPRQGEPHESIHPTLRKLHAAAYQGTFLKAYNLLTKIAASIGWDQLLKIRSEVFVMEEEYRVERQHVSTKPEQTSTNASSVAVNQEGSSAEPNGTGSGSESGPGSDENNDTAEKSPKVNGDNNQAKKSIERPELSMASEVIKSGNEDVGNTFNLLRCCTNWFISTTHHMLHTRISGTSVFARDGWTTFSWFSMRTSVYTPSGEPKWPNIASKALNIENRQPNGKFLANWPSVYTTSTQASKPIRTAYLFGSRRSPCAVFLNSTNNETTQEECSVR